MIDWVIWIIVLIATLVLGINWAVRIRDYKVGEYYDSREIMLVRAAPSIVVVESVLLVGVLIMDISKLHLLWLAPLSYFIVLYVRGKRVVERGGLIKIGERQIHMDPRGSGESARGEVTCASCSAELTLDPTELDQGIYHCPSCGFEGSTTEGVPSQTEEINPASAFGRKIARLAEESVFALREILIREENCSRDLHSLEHIYTLHLAEEYGYFYIYETELWLRERWPESILKSVISEVLCNFILELEAGYAAKLSHEEWSKEYERLLATFLSRANAYADADNNHRHDGGKSEENRFYLFGSNVCMTGGFNADIQINLQAANIAVVNIQGPAEMECLGIDEFMATMASWIESRCL